MPSRLPPFDEDLARASTLPAFAYTDAAVLAAERTRIFRRTWQPVGQVADLSKPGTFITAAVDDAPIVVTRDMKGDLHAFYNVCRHRAGPVAMGKGSRRSLTCKYHGWTYALGGELMTAPELGEIKDFDKSCHGLEPVRVETWGPLVFVNLDLDAEPLVRVLGDIPRETTPYRLDEMRLVARKDYEIACNWKVYVDNYLEGYHLPTVHPGLFKELDYDAYRVDTHRMYSTQIAPIRPAKASMDSESDGTSGGPRRQYAPTESEDLEAVYYWVFPNWMLNIYPDNMSLNIVLPLGVDRTLTIFEWFRHEGASEKEISRTIAFSDLIQEEDIEICEAVQRGLASGAYTHGRFSPLRENGVFHFQALVHEHLVSAPRRE
ncbi:MAG TPA: SRPBCC family protein [Labilithrix sp.]|nr:SRPBCC family protein [Labilithrix sp.]